MPIDIAGSLKNLVSLGYLTHASGTIDSRATRAIRRFQRHAARPHRVPPPDESAGTLYVGRVNGILDADTVRHIDKWIAKSWRLPLNRFPMTGLTGGGRLRADAAQAWEQIVGIVTGAGGTLEGPYGDTTRPVRPNTKVGASRYSFHYSGRAVDIRQGFANRNKNQRYFVCQDPSGGNTYWRIYCKTANQDGTQGSPMKKGDVKCYDFSQWSEYDISEGYYIDMTRMIQSTMKFERIKAQRNWSGTYNKTEWWHFQYALDKQKTFSDEMELIGYTEAQLRVAGWGADADLDHAPG